MRLIIFVLIILAAVPAFAAQNVKYIDAPKFENQIYLYGEPNKSDIDFDFDFEQWYEIEGRGQFVRNVKVPTLIPYLDFNAENSNGAAIIIAPGGAFLHHTFGSGGYEAAEWFKSQGFATFIFEITPRDEADYAEKMAGYRAGGLSGNYAPATILFKDPVILVTPLCHCMTSPLTRETFAPPVRGREPCNGEGVLAERRSGTPERRSY